MVRQPAAGDDDAFFAACKLDQAAQGLWLKAEQLFIEKQSRKGKVFYGCNQYPTCKFASWDQPKEGPCPQCEAPLLYEKASRGGSPRETSR